MDEETKKYLSKHKLDGVIRIEEDEYGGFPQGDLLTHFNLEKTTVEAGKRYALPRILKNGYVDPKTGEEVLPLLSFDDIYHAECLEVTSRVPYEALRPKDFEHSLRHIQTIAELQSYIVKRYAKSKLGVSSEAFLSRGVAKMLLKIARP